MIRLMPDAADSQARFDRLAQVMTKLDGVALGSSGRGFGSGALQINGRIFAMLTGGHLVVKLPRERVVSLVRSGEGLPFDAGKGRPMKEWVAIAGGGDKAWAAHATEARNFVSRLSGSN